MRVFSNAIKNHKALLSNNDSPVVLSFQIYIYLEICDEVIISCGAIAEKDLVALELSLNECGNTLISNNKYFVNLPVLTRILKFARRPKSLIDLIKQLSYLFSSSICPLTLFRRCVRNLSDASLIY